MDLELRGKVAVITGGSVGIGLAIAEGLAAEGVSLALIARNGERAAAEAERIARARAEEAGADGATLALVDIEDLPIAYLPGGAMRVRARVVGEIAASG